MMKGVYYGAPMRKWIHGFPVGASSKPHGLFRRGGNKKYTQKKRKSRSFYTSRRRRRNHPTSSQ